jgi:hypothetical protein
MDNGGGISISKAQDTVNLVLLAAIVGVIGFGAYEIWKELKCTLHPDQCGADNGQPRCTYADYSDGNCVSGDGASPCGFWEYWTATSCYKGTPTKNTPAQVAAAAADSSVLGGLKALVSPDVIEDPYPASVAPGLPPGYNPVTGEIDPSYETSQIEGTSLSVGDGGGE